MFPGFYPHGSRSDSEDGSAGGAYNGGYTDSEEGEAEDQGDYKESYDEEVDIENKRRKNWDVFKVIKTEQSNNKVRFWHRVHQAVRATLCIVFFFLLLLTAVLSKLLFLLTAYNVNGNDNERLDDYRAEIKINVPWLWSMIIIISAPYLFTVVRNSLRVVFKDYTSLLIIPLLVVVLAETLHSIGLCLFVCAVAPSFNPLVTLMLCQGVGILPSFNKLFWKQNDNPAIKKTHQHFTTSKWRALSVISFALLVAFISLCTWRVYYNKPQSITVVVLIPVSLLLISARWWDNFIQRVNESDIETKAEQRVEKKKRRACRRPSSLTGLLRMIDGNRVKIDLFVSVWKIVLTLVTPAILFATGGQGCAEVFALKQHVATGCGVLPGFTNLTLVYVDYDDCGRYFPFLVALISGLSSGIGYKIAKSACKIRSQVGCFSVPLVLATPLCCFICLISYSQPIAITEYLGCHFSWFNLKEKDIFTDLTILTKDYYLPLIIVGFLTILILCAHIWVPSAGRIEATDKLFNRPLYCGIFFDVSLMMNRRSDDDINIQTNNRKEKAEKANTEQFGGTAQRENNAPRLIICITMWHENEVEMLQLLKSLLKMDLDQTSRRLAHEYTKSVDKDFYTLETHIFFDNAFGDPKNGEDPYLVNKYVRTFVGVVNKAVSHSYKAMKINPPVKVVTPYGGQLIWTLPGRNMLTVHLKHSKKIRIKKRWSQVMYMYYLLSHKMVCLGEMNDIKLKELSQNTFLLTLDGDVDFEPSAVHMLLDRMKKNSTVGAACGRIHPIGSGPIVWYQKFEYAMSHWLQKAAEHVIGCVLCSPGCFSMFRASALMDDNVLAMYAEKSTEARQYIQYDQGEDRWLCTLLLQQGHRIEYCAAADARTFAPEGFKEFFNQRRRWIPSTMANILDVLQTAGRIRRKNNDISLLYIIYQGFLFISSILTPGTIFLLVFSAINTAYPALPLYLTMLLNLFPVVGFIIMLFTAKADHQIAYAEILSVLYSLVMMVVLIGVFKQIVESNFCSMSAAFFLFVVGIFLLAALLHPQEFFNVIHGFLYFLAIPCMSMLLVFYGIGNLNEVSWGTRETHKATVIPEQEKKEQKKTNFQNVLSKLKGSDDDDSDYVFSFGNLLRCICCPKPGFRDHSSKFELLLEKMEAVEYALTKRDEESDDELPTRVPAGSIHPARFNVTFEGGLISNNPLYEEEEVSEDDANGVKRWITDPTLGDRDSIELEEKEYTFWQDLVEKRLIPDDPSDKEKQEIADDLTALRNRVCMFFFLSNCLFVTLMFILESVAQYTPSLIFHLPCDADNKGSTGEPVAIAFTLIFGVLLLVQFICMLIHRFSTLLAIASIAEVSMKGDTAEDQFNKRLKIVEELYGVKDNYGDDSSKFDTLRSRVPDPRDSIFRRMVDDSKKMEQDLPAENLEFRFTNNFKNVLKTLDQVDKGTLPKNTPLTHQSLFALAEIVPKEDRKELRKQVQKKWKELLQQMLQQNRKSPDTGNGTAGTGDGIQDPPSTTGDVVTHRF